MHLTYHDSAPHTSAALPASAGKAGAPEIPEELLFESYRTLCPGSCEKPFMDEYKAAVLQLISALSERGWKIAPPVSDIPQPDSTANPERIRSIDLDSEGGRG